MFSSIFWFPEEKEESLSFDHIVKIDPSKMLEALISTLLASGSSKGASILGNPGARSDLQELGKTFNGFESNWGVML